MEFSIFKSSLRTNFEKMSQNASHLFEVSLDKDRLWNLYLESFPEGTNQMFRKRREYDCSECRHFVKAFGNVVFIENNQLKTIWDFNTGDPQWQVVADALATYVKSNPVTDVYVTKLKAIGTERSMDLTGNSALYWDHLHVKMPAAIFQNCSHDSDETVKASFRDIRNVFKRSLDEITRESIEIVLELISQNSLYKGEEWRHALSVFLALKADYDELQNESEKENYAWKTSVGLGVAIGKIRNHSMGTLLVNLSDNIELDEAVRKYESIVAPTNYKRPKALFTQRMLDDAKKTIEGLGLMDSLPRRHATLDDIHISNVLFSNRDAARRMSGTANVFEEMKPTTVNQAKQFSRLEEIPIEKFVKEVLPTVREMEVWLENKHQPNFVSLIAPENKDAKSMFKWNNGFSWAYAGNITDSDIKSNVKAAGGNVEGVLRFSPQWNDIPGEQDNNDLDAHCFEPDGTEIYYGDKRSSITGGSLDIDIINPREGVPAVENITYSDVRRMRIGTYQMFVENYTNRGGKNGFRAEIECEGTIHRYDYRNEVRQKERVHVADVILDRTGHFTVKDMLPGHASSREIWGLTTNQFIPVSLMSFSPNYWDEDFWVGNCHFFFMLKGCANPEHPNGFYNEFLKEDLSSFRHVFEALGSKMAVKDSPDQLSGLGFSYTKRAELIVKITGQSERVAKIIF